MGEIIRGLHTSGPIVEIGTLYGWSARIMILFKEEDRRLITVDRFSWNPHGLSSDQHERITKLILEEGIGEYRVELIRMDKNDFYRTYCGDPPSLVFLDAGHDYDSTREDLQWACRSGAEIISGHDYNPDKWPGVVDAVDEFGGCAARVGSLWVLNAGERRREFVARQRA